MSKEYTQADIEAAIEIAESWEAEGNQSGKYAVGSLLQMGRFVVYAQDLQGQINQYVWRIEELFAAIEEVSEAVKKRPGSRHFEYWPIHQPISSLPGLPLPGSNP